MRVRLSISAVSALLLAACGGGGPAAPAGLAYSVPSVGSVTYITADTSAIDIDAMGQTMQVAQSGSSTVDVTFSGGGDAIEVSLTYVDYEASISQPMGAPVSANEGDIDGPLVFTMDRKGNVTPVSSPTLSGTAEQLFGPTSTMHMFFPGLPGTGVGPGDMWADTVSYVGNEGGGEIDATMIAEYTVVGDETVDGRSLLRIDVQGGGATDVSANMGGMDVFQSVTMSVSGYMLWDMAAGLMVERVLEMDGEGTVEVAMAPAPMGIMLSGISITRLSN